MRALKTILVLSLLLNVALVGGALFGLFAGGTAGSDPQAHIAEIAADLDLTEAQVSGLRAFRERTVERLAAQRAADSERGGTREQLVEMLDDEAYDTDRVQQLLVARAEQRSAFWAEVGSDLHGWVAGLPKDKQARFVEMAKERSFFRQLFARGE